MIYVCYTNTPIGRLRLESEGEAICGLYFPRHRHQDLALEAEESQGIAVLEDATRQLQEYFGGWRKQFDLPLAMKGTAFQKEVWQELLKIPYGETISYGQLAQRIGKEKAVRAVGLANGRNPISIVVPCHRVIGSNGTLTGYGGGLENKEYLLRLEGGLPLDTDGISSGGKRKRQEKKSPGPMLPFGPGESDGGELLG